MINKNDLSDKIKDLIKSVQALEDDYLAASPFKEISTRDFKVIEAIASAKEDTSMKNVAAILGITQGTLSTSVNALEKKKLVSRQSDKNDKRSTNLVLSKVAIKANDYHQKLYYNLLDYAYGILSYEDLAGFSNGISAVKNSIIAEKSKLEQADLHNSFLIITDSASDISSALSDTLGVRVLPMSVKFGDSVFKDGADIDEHEFYKMQANSEHLPVTSQVDAKVFLDIFSECKNTGKQLLYIGISSKISKMIEIATQAKADADFDGAFIFDTLAASSGQRAFVELAASLRNEGKNPKEIMLALKTKQSKMKFFAIFDDIGYLVKGGRLAKKVNSESLPLNSKPIVKFSKGEVSLVKNPIGRQKAYEYVLSLIEKADVDYSLPTCITYSYSKEIYDEFEEYAKSKGSGITNFGFGSKRLESSSPIKLSISEAGAVIGSHAGRNCLAISFFEK